MKQTAVEWLVEQMRQPNWMSIPTTDWIQQAKQSCRSLNTTWS